MISSFFNYGDLSESEINEIVQDHLLSLLDTAIDKIYEYGLPDFDFYDKDNDLQHFNDELVPQEVSLLSDLMYLAYVEEDRNKLKAYGLVFRTSEVNVLFSPANDRRTYIEMIEKIESKVTNSVINYLSRNRLTWKEKSIYGG